jgi:cytochrome c biogenesis protein CcmG/thiol:disulfide interchange protein DsbE
MALARAPLLAALLAACAAPGARGGSGLVSRPVDIAVPSLAGATVRIGDDGARVRVVDFWASWCEPCRDQLPALDRLSRALGPRGAAFYAVSFDEDRAQIDEFLKEHPVGFPVLWDRGGEALSERLRVSRLPTTLVLDAAGVVRHVHVGAERGEEERIEREVRALLAE